MIKVRKGDFNFNALTYFGFFFLNMRLQHINYIAFSLLLSACGPSKKTTNNSVEEHVFWDTITVRANDKTMDIYRSSEPIYWDIHHSIIQLSFDYEQKTAKGISTLQLSAYNEAMDSLVLDAKSMDIEKVQLKNNNQWQSLVFHQEEDKLNIRLGEKWSRGDTAFIQINYTAKPYATKVGGSAAIREDRGLYFINTDGKIKNKPKQIWTQGETQANSHWMPTIDQPNERFTMRLELTVPDSFVTLANGSLDVSVKADKNLRTDIWQMNKPIQTYAYMFAIGEFDKVMDSSWRNKEIAYYVEPEFQPYASTMFRHTPEMIDYFSKVTGVAYPWNKYSQIVVRDYVSGAMENTSASLFGEFMNQDFREIADQNHEDVVSHELFHQWFGDYVTAESWSNLTVNESFATYGEQLWRHYKYGPAATEELAYDDLNKYINTAGMNDAPLVRFHYRNREVMFDRISYQKGGTILRYLHGLIGNDAFSRAMKIYLSKNALQSAEAHQWRMAVEEATGLDWNWFFNQWYFQGGHPKLNFKYIKNDSLQQLTIQVDFDHTTNQKIFRYPLKLGVFYGQELQLKDWTIDNDHLTLDIPYKNGIAPLVVPDYYFWLPGVIKENKTSHDWLQQIKTVPNYANKRKALIATFSMARDTSAQVVYHLALKDSLEGIRYFALKSLLKINAESEWKKSISIEELKQVIDKEKSHRVRAAALDVMQLWKLKLIENELMTFVQDSSYMVAGSALQLLQQLDSNKANSKAKELLNVTIKSDLEDAVWEVLAQNAVKENAQFFIKAIPQLYGSDKNRRISSFVQYLKIVNEFEPFEKGVELLINETRNAPDAAARYAVGRQLISLNSYFEKQLSSQSTDLAKQKIKESKSTLLKLTKLLINKEEKDEENLKKYNQI